MKEPNAFRVTRYSSQSPQDKQIRFRSPNFIVSKPLITKLSASYDESIGEPLKNKLSKIPSKAPSPSAVNKARELLLLASKLETQPISPEQFGPKFPIKTQPGFSILRRTSAPKTTSITYSGIKTEENSGNNHQKKGIFDQNTTSSANTTASKGFFSKRASKRTGTQAAELPKAPETPVTTTDGQDNSSQSRDSPADLPIPKEPARSNKPQEEQNVDRQNTESSFEPSATAPKNDLVHDKAQDSNPAEELQQNRHSGPEATATSGSENDSNMKLNDLLMNPFWMNKQLPLKQIRKLMGDSRLVGQRKVRSLKSCLKVSTFVSNPELPQSEVGVNEHSPKNEADFGSISVSTASTGNQSVDRSPSPTKKVQFSKNAIVYHLKPHKWEDSTDS